MIYYTTKKSLQIDVNNAMDDYKQFIYRDELLTKKELAQKHIYDLSMFEKIEINKNNTYRKYGMRFAK